MEKLKWDDSLSVNVEIIDDQHKRLIGMINDLQNALQEGRATQALNTILDGLADYTVYHFQAEEECAAEYGSQL